MRRFLVCCLAVGFAAVAGRASLAAEGEPAAGKADNALVMVVMDPLAKPLSCPCVAGYAQRDYDALAERLGKALGRPVKTTYAESLKAALKKTEGRAHLVIGKHSVVLYDSKATELPCTAVAALTGKDGATTQTGMIVVASGDSAKTVADLRGYRIIFGPEECDEKHSAALVLLAKHQVPSPKDLEVAPGCEDGCIKILELPEGEHGAAVISSYAKPLLEGCGTVEKGALRVVGETEPLPFIEAFVTSQLTAEESARLAAALFDATKDATLRVKLETKDGFVPIPATKKPDVASAAVLPPAAESADVQVAATTAAGAAWPGWRGPNRDGLTSWLPEKLSESPQVLWRKRLSGPVLGGLAATDRWVIVPDREGSDRFDIFRCLDAETGAERWAIRLLAMGELDYGNSPRATPLIHEGRVYLLNAFGLLLCADLDSGQVLWRKDLYREFKVKDRPIWGTCCSPLIVDDMLIVNPGGAEASIVALKPTTGDVIWSTPGDAAAYSSLIVATLGGRRQLVGYDQASLGGWDPATGERLWKLVPPRKHDFNVPTPIVTPANSDGEQLLVVSTENNGTRAYKFDAEGKIVSEPVAENADLAPDSHSPVAVAVPAAAGNTGAEQRLPRLFGVWEKLYCLDLRPEHLLKPVWLAADPAFNGHTVLEACENRLLVVSQKAELLLIDSAADEYRLISRLQVFEDDDGVYSHPAIIGQKLYLRGSEEIICLDLRSS